MGLGWLRPRFDLGLCAAPGLPGGGVALAEDVSFLLEDITVLLAAEKFTIFPEFFMAGHLLTADFVGRLSISDFHV